MDQILTADHGGGQARKAPFLSSISFGAAKEIDSAGRARFSAIFKKIKRRPQDGILISFPSMEAASILLQARCSKRSLYFQ
ncbi:hypothetical protein [Pseudodesulfovibrio nedwellii]|uniref:hypothetical protein n=1 Tax=Pseudodesulfovibrio nedwellii TaxID=2973072 RepID=UPI00249388DF|nr:MULTISPECIES: hypothetical protein [Pseudodesulfovibrio]